MQRFCEIKMRYLLFVLDLLKGNGGFYLEVMENINPNLTETMSETISSCVINNFEHPWHRFFHGKHEDFAGTKLWEKAKDELNEIPERREQDIQYLRNLLLTRHPDVKCDLSDSFLLKFLRVRKFDPERALKLICEYYQAQVNYPSIYKEYWPSSVAELLKEGVVTVLPDTDKEGRAIIVFRFSKWDTSKFQGDDATRALLLTIEAVLREERFQINGVIIILDCEGFSLSHLAVLTPRFVYRCANSVQRWQPFRLKALIYANASLLLYIAFGIVVPFFTKKLRQRTHIFGDPRALQNFVDENVLPIYLGGTNSDYSKFEEQWYNRMCSLEDTFRENCTKYGYNRTTLD